MAPPNLASTGTIGDGGLTALPEDDTGVIMKVGGSTLGVAGTIYSFRGTDIASVITTLGKGRAVDDLISHLIKSGGKTTRFIKAATSTAGTNSSVTQTGGGPAVTLTGTPDDDYSVIVEILLGGVVATATFRFSLDGGDSYSGTLLTAATYLLPSGVTLNFAAGTYVIGTLYTFTSTSPAMTSGDIAAALDIAIASPLSWEAFHVVGSTDTAANAFTLAATLTTKITAAHSAHRWIWGIFELPAVTAASIVTAAASYTDRFLLACGGYAEIAADRSDVPENLLPKRCSSFVIVPRLARNDISIHPVRSASDEVLEAVLPDSGALVLAPAVSGDSSGYYDENVTGTLNDARIAVLRTFDGRPGAYVANAPMLAGPTSDLQSAMDARVILRGANLFYQFSLDQLGKRLRTNADGTIAASSANAIDDAGTAFVKAGLAGDIQDAAVLVRRTDNIAATKTLRAVIRIKAWDHVFEFDWEVALTTALPAAA